MLDSIRPVYDNSLRGKGGPNSKFHGKNPKSLRLHLIKYIDMKNAIGKKVACRKILNWFQNKHAVYYIKHSLLRAMIDIGLSYKSIKPKVCNNNVAHIF